MTDYVSVDPPRVKALADALQKGASELPEAKSSIKKLISGWEGTWDASKVEALITFLEASYRDMADRADLAFTAAHRTSAGMPGSTMTSIPWTVTKEMKAQEGADDAKYIAANLDSDDDDVRIAAQKELAGALDAHADDPSWMQAFLENGGSQVVVDGGKSVLDGHLPPSDDGKVLLDSYAKGTAALSSFAEKNDIPDDALAPFYDKDNVVPVGVMMKYGPKGTEYGTKFLTNVGKAALDWRADHQEPKYDGTVVGYDYAYGVDQSDGDWWTDYDIDIDYYDSKPSDIERGTPLITEYDPVQGILNRVGDDHKASNDILTGEDGPHYANILTSPRWSNFVSDGAAKTIVAGTNRFVDGKSGAEAAANVFEQTFKQSEQGDQDSYGYDPKIAQALSTMASGYTADLAKSVQWGDGPTSVTGTDAHPTITTNRAVINGFLKLMQRDPKAAGNFQGALDAQTQAAAYTTAKWPHSKDTTNLLYQTGFLQGMVQTQFNDMGFEDASKQDAENARNKAYTDAAVGIIGSIPGAGDAFGFVWGAGSAIYGAAGDSLFPTDAAETAGRESQYTTTRGGDDLELPMAQGVLDSKEYAPPKDASFIHDGVISPQSDEQLAAFRSWWADLPDDVSNRIDGRSGYDDATSSKSVNDDSYDPPSK